MPTATDDRKYIGGSTAPAVLGLSRWSTPLQIWAEMTGQIEREHKEGLHLTLGNRLEEVVAELFTEKTGLKVRRANETIFHKDYPFLGGNIDRAVVGKREGLECKTASAWKAKEWAGEEIPQEYIIQCHHYLAVTGWDAWWVAVLIGNQDFQVKKIERDENLLKALVEKERVFWEEYVVPQVMPTTITAKDSDTLEALFPNATMTQVVLGDEVTRLIENRNALIQDLKTVESQVDKLENEIKASLRENESGVAGKYRVTWKNQVQNRLDQKRLKEERPELYNLFLAETKFRKFDIREVKHG